MPFNFFRVFYGVINYAPLEKNMRYFWYKKRAGIEGTISQGTRAFDLRITRYIGLANTHLQQCLSAIAMNLVRLAHWLEGIVPAQTRTSSGNTW